jgi:Predicted dehydrogenases and related proteins
MKQLNFGIVGIGGRPSSFLSAFENSGKACLVAVCDLDEVAMEKAVEGLGEVKKFVDYNEMLEKCSLDAVIIGTPIPLHVSQSIAALEKNISVFSEVTAAVSIEECMQLVAVCKTSKARYMMGENCNYMKENMIVAEMVQAGLFGEVFYAEGEYLHDCRELLDKTPWRRKLFFNTSGITYGSHSLGPILSWFKGDRITRVCCAGSGHHNRDFNGTLIGADDTSVMLAQTCQGRLIKVRIDIHSYHPYTLRYTLQGTEGAYEAIRQENNQNCKHVWLQNKSEKEKWDYLSQYEEQYLPELWRDHGKAAEIAGHEGSDYIIMTDYINALYDGKAMPIDVHGALDMTLPGLVSQQSILQGGIWLDVPDSREW